MQLRVNGDDDEHVGRTGRQRFGDQQLVGQTRLSSWCSRATGASRSRQSALAGDGNPGPAIDQGTDTGRPNTSHGSGEATPTDQPHPSPNPEV